MHRPKKRKTRPDENYCMWTISDVCIFSQQCFFLCFIENIFLVYLMLTYCKKCFIFNIRWSKYKQLEAFPIPQTIFMPIHLGGLLLSCFTLLLLLVVLVYSILISLFTQIMWWPRILYVSQHHHQHWNTHALENLPDTFVVFRFFFCFYLVGFQTHPY